MERESERKREGEVAWEWHIDIGPHPLLPFCLLVQPPTFILTIASLKAAFAVKKLSHSRDVTESLFESITLQHQLMDGK